MCSIAYRISQEICTRFLLCCVLLWLYIDWFPISIRHTSLALWQSNDCPGASKATLMNMDKYFMWIHYERLHNHNKAKHNKTVCIFLGIYCNYGLTSTTNTSGTLCLWAGASAFIHFIGMFLSSFFRARFLNQPKIVCWLVQALKLYSRHDWALD